MIRIFVFAITFFLACSSPEEKSVQLTSKKNFQEKMIASHKAYLRLEKIKINSFIDSIGIPFKKSETGLRHHIYSNGGRDSLHAGEIAVVDYVLTLLDGDTAYSTIGQKPQQFIVEFDNIENGLHEGIQYMAVGDSAVFILPAHLGHGITGDQAAIPYQSILVYKVFLLAKRL